MTSLLFVLLLITVFIIKFDQSSGEINSLKLKIVNYAGSPIQIFWINTFSSQRDLVMQTSKPLRNNSDASINTYETHQFSVRWLKHVPGEDFNFTMGNVDETRVVRFDLLSHSFFVERVDARSEIISTIEDLTHHCMNPSISTKELMKQCLVHKLGQEFTRVLETTQLVTNYHDKMVDRIEQYVCLEGFANNSKPIDSLRYKFLERNYRNDIFLVEANSQIWSTYDFISVDECKTLFPPKRESTFVESVVGSFGALSFLKSGNENVVPKNSTYPLNSNVRADRLWPLIDRVFRTLNFYGELNVQPSSTNVKVFLGKTHKSVNKRPVPANSGKVLLFCEIDEKDNSLVFPYADIQIKPKQNMALFTTAKSGRLSKELVHYIHCPVDSNTQVVEIELFDHFSN